MTRRLAQPQRRAAMCTKEKWPKNFDVYLKPQNSHPCNRHRNDGVGEVAHHNSSEAHTRPDSHQSFDNYRMPFHPGGSKQVRREGHHMRAEDPQTRGLPGEPLTWPVKRDFGRQECAEQRTHPQFYPRGGALPAGNARKIPMTR